MTEGNGPLSAYAGELLPMIENIGSWTERRNFMAHGFMTMFTDPSGKHCFKFRYYEAQGDGLIFHQWFATADDLQDADAINRCCSAFVALHQRIYSELGIG